MEEIFKYLNASGDVGVWLMVLMMWRLDQRTRKLEYKVFGWKAA